MRSLLILITVTLLLPSCNNEKAERVSLDNYFELKPTKYPLIQTLCINDIMAGDNLVLINDWCSDSGFFHVIDYPEMKKTYSFALKGRGPGEYITPFFINNIVDKTQLLNFSVYDLNLKLKGDYTLSQNNGIANKKDKTGLVRKKVIPDKIFPCINLSMYDSCYYGNDLGFTEGLFFIYDLRTDTRRWIDFVPNKDRVKQKSHPSFVFTNRLAVNGNKKKIAVAMTYFNNVNFFDIQGTYLKSISVGQNFLPVIDEKTPEMTEDSYKYSIDIYGTNDYVYVLWGGQKLKEYKANKVLYSFVIVFNWNGDYIQTLKIQNSYQIAINPANTILFASGAGEDGTTEISTYNLMKLPVQTISK
jgi:hypothetical protein